MTTSQYTPAEIKLIAAAVEVNHARNQFDSVWNDDSRETVEDAAICVELAEALLQAVRNYRAMLETQG